MEVREDGTSRSKLNLNCKLPQNTCDWLRFEMLGTSSSRLGRRMAHNSKEVPVIAEWLRGWQLPRGVPLRCLDWPRILRDQRIGRKQGDTLHGRLRHQDTVKRIFVNWR